MIKTLKEKLATIYQELNTKLIAGNIKKDVTILSVTGTYEGTAPTGTINITTNGTHDVTNYASANVSVTEENYAKIGVPTSYTYDSHGLLEYITKVIDFDMTGIGTDINSFFRYCVNLTEVKFKNVDASTVNYSNFFMGCINLTKIEGLDISHATNLKQTFRGCLSLVNLPALTAPNATNLSNAFLSCTSLSNDSLNNVLALCASATGSTTKTLAYIGLTSDQATTCTTLSNWSAAQAAGWTKGY